ncbi:hypothetical protein Tco_1423495 [Tanacetum coccineum]
MERVATTASSLEAEQDNGSGPRCQDTILEDVDAQTRFETTSKQSNKRLHTWKWGGQPNLVLPVQVNAAEDLLNSALLSVNLIIYTSCIQQFWATAKANTVNGKRQLQALIDKKRVIITESSIRSDLHLEDAGGTDCLPTATIFEELARIGAKSTAWNEFSSTMASLIICLATNQKFNMSKYIFDAMVKHLDGGVLDLEKAKDAQAKKIADLKKRVQKVESSEDKDSLGNHEDASKQGRSIEDIDKDADVSLVDDTQGR